MESAFQVLVANAIQVGRTPRAQNVTLVGRVTIAMSVIHAGTDSARLGVANAIQGGRTPVVLSVMLAGRVTIVTSAILTRA